MEPFAIAVKAFIVREGKILLLKRRGDDAHRPGVWDLPGGRINQGENPFAGLRREAREETGLDVEVRNPLRVHHFTRDDGQRITMIVFLCTSAGEGVTLSEEHTEASWVSVDRAKDIIAYHYHKDVDTYVRFFQKAI